MKKYWIIGFLCLFLLSFPIQAESTPFGDPEEYLPGEVTEQLPSGIIGKIETGEGGIKLLWEKIVDLFRHITPELQQGFVQCFGLLILCAAIKAFPFAENGQAITFVSSLAVMTLGGKWVVDLWEMVQNAILSMHRMMTAMLPVITSLLLVGGNESSAGVQGSILTLVLGVMEWMLTKGFLPLLSVLFALTILSTFLSSVPVSVLLERLRRFFLWGIGLFYGILALVLTYQSVIAAAKDNLTAKTLKFAVGNSIPIVGGAMGESVRTLISGLSLLRSTVGGAGILALCYLVFPPLFTLLSYRVLFSLADFFGACFDCNEVGGLFCKLGELLRFAIVLLLGSTLFFVLMLILFSVSQAAYA